MSQIIKTLIKSELLWINTKSRNSKPDYKIIENLYLIKCLKQMKNIIRKVMRYSIYRQKEFTFVMLVDDIKLRRLVKKIFRKLDFDTNILVVKDIASVPRRDITTVLFILNFEDNYVIKNLLHQLILQKKIKFIFNFTKNMVNFSNNTGVYNILTDLSSIKKLLFILCFIKKIAKFRIYVRKKKVQKISKNKKFDKNSYKNFKAEKAKMEKNKRDNKKTQNKNVSQFSKKISKNKTNNIQRK